MTLFNKEFSLPQLHTESHAGSLGICSFTDLVTTLRSHGLKATAVNIKKIPVNAFTNPMILFVDGDHFLTVLPITGSHDELVVIDPPRAPYQMSWSAMKARWNGDAIVVSD
jgi:ABC-type bacteriocin/lantibiotic exporter with double-glycine peptidase domain